MSQEDLSRHINCGVTMNVDLIEKLTEGFDPAVRGEVLEGLRNGFPLGVEREPPPRSWAPSFMDDASRARVRVGVRTSGLRAKS